MSRLACSVWVRHCRPNATDGENGKAYFYPTLHQNPWGYQGAKNHGSQVGNYLGYLCDLAS